MNINFKEYKKPEKLKISQLKPGTIVKIYGDTIFIVPTLPGLKIIWINDGKLEPSNIFTPKDFDDHNYEIMGELEILF